MELLGPLPPANIPQEVNYQHFLHCSGTKLFDAMHLFNEGCLEKKKYMNVPFSGSG